VQENGTPISPRRLVFETMGRDALLSRWRFEYKIVSRLANKVHMANVARDNFFGLFQVIDNVH